MSKLVGFCFVIVGGALKKHDEPQHLIKFDPHKVERDFNRMGWVNVPENPFLFIKEV